MYNTTWKGQPWKYYYEGKVINFIPWLLQKNSPKFPRLTWSKGDSVWTSGSVWASGTQYDYQVKKMKNKHQNREIHVPGTFFRYRLDQHLTRIMWTPEADEGQDRGAPGKGSTHSQHTKVTTPGVPSTAEITEGTTQELSNLVMT